MQFKPNTDGACGTSLQGYVNVKYSTLVLIFGEPHCDGDGYKVDAEWMLKFEDGTIATIYNYKDGENYNGVGNEYATKTVDITDWHVGGNSKHAVTCVLETLAEKLEVAVAEKLADVL